MCKSDITEINNHDNLHPSNNDNHDHCHQGHNHNHNHDHNQKEHDCNDHKDQNKKHDHHHSSKPRNQDQQMNKSLLKQHDQNDEFLDKKQFNYKIPENEHITKQVLTKLIVVSIIAFIFLIAEVVGGVISGSLAILSDAAHMFSDFTGFIISIVSVYISQRPASKIHSFGYHRSEVIGALLSIVIIWVLTIILVAEATVRIVNKDSVSDPFFMLITAAFGLVCNLVMAKVLHSRPGHSHHGCSHGNSNKHDHKHDHQHDHGENHHSSGDHEHNNNNNQKQLPESKNKDECKSSNDNHNHNHENTHSCGNKNKEQNQDEKNMVKYQHISTQDSCEEKDNINHDHNNCNHKKVNENKENNGTIQNPQCQNQNSQKNDEENHQKDHNHSEKHKCDGHNYETTKNENNITKEQQQDIKSKKNLSVMSAEENYNLRAAMIHVLGDIIQSIGVLISALLIYFLGDKTEDEYNYWHLTDPLCTYIFSILVLMTTKNISKDCFRVLMEGSPIELDINELEQKIKSIKNVVEIHDLHIWSLAKGKPSLSCHIFINADNNNNNSNIRDVLKNTTILCRENGIYHTTIQIEEYHLKNQMNYIKCEHNIHF